MLFYYVTLDMPILTFIIIFFQFIHEVCQRHQRFVRGTRDYQKLNLYMNYAKRINLISISVDSFRP